jgi:hypothetical protein
MGRRREVMDIGIVARMSAATCGTGRELKTPDVAVCPEGRVSPVEEESTQIVVDRSGS